MLEDTNSLDGAHIVKQHCSKFRIITAIFSGAQTVKVVWTKATVKKPKNKDTQNICCNYPKIRTVLFYYRKIGLKDADGTANSVDPDQTAPLGLHCLPRRVCPKP